MDLALKRLRDALDQLETATAKLGRDGAHGDGLAAALAVAQGEHGRLAGELEAARARAATLEHAATEVAGRLGAAGSSLRALLAAEDET